MVTLRLNENKLMANEKGFCKSDRLEGTYWTVAPPSGHFGNEQNLKANVEKRTNHRGSLSFDIP